MIAAILPFDLLLGDPAIFKDLTHPSEERPTCSFRYGLRLQLDLRVTSPVSSLLLPSPRPFPDQVEKADAVPLLPPLLLTYCRSLRSGRYLRLIDVLREEAIACSSILLAEITASSAARTEGHHRLRRVGLF